MSTLRSSHRWLASFSLTCLLACAGALSGCLGSDAVETDALDDGDEAEVETAEQPLSYLGGLPGFVIPIGNTGLCLTALPDAKVVQQPCAPGNAMQRWTSRATSTGTELKNMGNLRCLDVAYANPVIHQEVNTFQCHNGLNQRFHIMSVPGNVEQTVSAGVISSGILVADGSALCLDLAGGNNIPGNPLQLFTCHGGQNQLFAVRGGPFLLSSHTDSEDADYIMEFHTFVSGSHIDVRLGPGERGTFDSQPYVDWSAWEWGDAYQQLHPDTGDTQCPSGTTMMFVLRTLGNDTFNVSCYR